MISIKTNFKNIDFTKAIKKAIAKSTLLVQGKAIKNAPVWDYRAINRRDGGARQWWTLRRSITTKMTPTVWKVWTNVPYARIREFVNKKNPHTKFYMKRALESSENEIEKIFYKEIRNVYDNI